MAEGKSLIHSTKYLAVQPERNRRRTFSEIHLIAKKRMRLHIALYNGEEYGMFMNTVVEIGKSYTHICVV